MASVPTMPITNPFTSNDMTVKSMIASASALVPRHLHQSFSYLKS
jgi:hypothetical protein